MPEIPIQKLDEGIRLCKKHIEQLIDSSDVLVRNEKFLSSLPFSILAMEHYGYLLMLQQSKNERKSITESQWKKRITHHPAKLKFAYEIAHPEYRKDRMRIWNLLEIPKDVFSGFALEPDSYPYSITKTSSDISHDDLTTGSLEFTVPKSLKDNFSFFEYLQLNSGNGKPKESDLKRLTSFDFMKQDVFYLNYISDWFSVYDELKQDEQKALAIIFLISIKYDFWNHQLASFYPHLDTRRRNSILRHPIYQKMRTLESRVDMDEFKKHRKIAKEVIMKHYDNRIKSK